MTPALAKFKDELVRELGIVGWSPNEQNLLTIARRAAKSNLKSTDDIHAIVSEVCPNTIFLAAEGLDNSDLRTLLTLAIAAAKQG